MSRLIERTGVLRYPRTTAIGRSLSAIRRSTLAPCSGIIDKTPALQTPQTRKLWHFANKRRRGRDSAAFDRIYDKLPLKRYRRAPHHLQQNGFGNRPWWRCGWGLGWCRFKSSFSGRRRRWNPDLDDIWEEEGTRLRERAKQMERMQKEIEQDPYTAMFGRRREPFMETEAYRSWSDFCRAFLGLGRSAGGDGRAADTTARAKEDGLRSAGFGPVRTATGARDRLDEAAESDLEFDPISGRMVQKPRVVDMGDLGTSAKPLDEEPAEADGQGAFGKSKADSVDGLVAKTQQKPARKSTRKGRAKRHADVAHAIPEAQAQASDTGAEPPGVITAEPPKEQSDAAPQHMDSGEAGDQLPDSRNVHAPALDVGESPREPEQNAVSDPKQEWPSKEEKDLEFLSASDIRASYASRRLNTDPEIQKQEDRRALEDEFEAYVDPASKIDAQDIRERYDDSANRVDGSCPATTESGAGVVESAHENTALDTEAASSQSPEADQTLHESTSPAMYRVLAYDSSTLQVTRAETSSSHAANEVLHPTDVLSRLNNAAKFLPHFADMHRDGYEIVSGGGDILVFKKVRSGEGSWAAPAGSDYDTGYPPDDVMIVGGTCQSPEAAKHESAYPGCPPNRPPYPPPTHDQPVSEADIPLPKSESTFRRTARRMLFAGGATAATCYAMGVVIEYFRTGGPDGRGIDGFTEFESDRRRRNE